MRLRWVRLWADSGGAGRYRGGLGYEAEVEWLRGEGTLSVRRDRHRTGPWGLFGGQAAPPCRTLLIHPDGSEEEIPSKKVLTIRAGDVMRVWTSGGGGYGDPLERPAEVVLEDVLDGRVSVDRGGTRLRRRHRCGRLARLPCHGYAPRPPARRARLRSVANREPWHACRTPAFMSPHGSPSIGTNQETGG